MPRNILRRAGAAFAGREPLSAVVLWWGLVGNGVWVAVALLVVVDNRAAARGAPSFLDAIRPLVDLETYVLSPGVYLYLPLSIYLMWKNSGNSARHTLAANLVCGMLLLGYLAFLATTIGYSLLVG